MTPPTLWDFAGVDGPPVARALFGEAAARLSVWQSLDTDWNGTPCAVLRLCEGNYRVASYGNGGEALGREAAGRRVWIKPARLVTLAARDTVKLLLPLASVKPPHRLAGLPIDRAVPARLGDYSVVLWRHTVAGTPILDVQAVPGDGAAVRDILCQGGLL